MSEQDPKQPQDQKPELRTLSKQDEELVASILKDHPGLTRAEVLEYMEAMGF